MICARTDARSVEDFQAVVRRSKAYIDVGVDMIFPEGLKNLDEFMKLSKQLKSYNSDVLLLANMTEFGVTDAISFG